VSIGTSFTKDFFARSCLSVAPDLIGAYLVRTLADGTRLAGRIVEVEAYLGDGSDPGSHSHRGLTPRNRVMFGPPGRLYVYRHLGLHHCVNVVCGPSGEAAAVLLRAGEVVEGAGLARRRREEVGRCDSDRQIARGPARLAVALDLVLDHDSTDVTDPDGALVLHLPVDPLPRTVATGARVGVAGEGADPARFAWRSWLVDEPTVSAYRPVTGRLR